MPPFMFSDMDFRHLATWPLYKHNIEELPLHSIVSVGYTIGVYSGTSGLGLSSNVQFMIVLAVPPDA